MIDTDVVTLSYDSKNYYCFYWKNHLYQMKTMKSLVGSQLTSAIFYDLILSQKEEAIIIIEQDSINYKILNKEDKIFDSISSNMTRNGIEKLIYEAIANDSSPTNIEKPYVYTNKFICLTFFDLIQAITQINDSCFNFVIEDYINQEEAFLPIEIYYNELDSKTSIIMPYQFNTEEEYNKIRPELEKAFSIKENPLGNEIEEYKNYKKQKLNNKGLIKFTEFILEKEKDNSVFDYENLFYKELNAINTLRNNDSIITNNTAYKLEIDIMLKLSQNILNSISIDLKYIKQIQERYL